jgi:N-acyl-phosphatidylethanolamine-hydrolysing phospholipase D
MTDEPIDEPPRRVASALASRGMPADAFITVKHGETWKMPLS